MQIPVNILKMKCLLQRKMFLRFIKIIFSIFIVLIEEKYLQILKINVFFHNYRAANLLLRLPQDNQYQQPPTTHPILTAAKFRWTFLISFSVAHFQRSQMFQKYLAILSW